MFLSLFNNCAILRPAGPTTGKWCGNRKTTPFLIVRKIVNRIAEGAMKTDKPQISKRRTNRKILLYKSDQSAILKPPIFQFKKANCSLKDLLWNDLFHPLPLLRGNWSCLDSSKWQQSNTSQLVQHQAKLFIVSFCSNVYSCLFCDD